MEELPLIGIHNVIAMNFDSETDCVFRLDIDKDRIMKQCLSDGSLPETLAMSQLSSVEGMAFDHISKILYFVDVTRKSIELVKVDSQKGGHMRKTIIRGVKIKPRGIAVHPTQGSLLYSDWADKAASIGRARLDGSNYSIIIDTDDRGRRILGWPNGCSNHTCSHLCVSMPPNSGSLYKCLCPDGMKTFETGTECQCPDDQVTQQNGTCPLWRGWHLTISARFFISWMLLGKVSNW